MKHAHPAWRALAFLLVLAGFSVGLRVANKIDSRGFLPKSAVRAMGCGAGAAAGAFAFRLLWVAGTFAREAGRVRRDARAARALARAADSPKASGATG